MRHFERQIKAASCHVLEVVVFFAQDLNRITAAL